MLNEPQTETGRWLAEIMEVHQDDLPEGWDDLHALIAKVEAEALVLALDADVPPDLLIRAGEELLRKAAIQPGGQRFGFPTWQVDNASIEALREAVACAQDEQTLRHALGGPMLAQRDPS